MIKHRLALLPSHCVPRKHTHMQVQEGVGGIRLFLLKLSPVLNCGLKEKKKETKKNPPYHKNPSVAAEGGLFSNHLCSWQKLFCSYTPSAPSAPWSVTQLYRERTINRINKWPRTELPVGLSMPVGLPLPLPSARCSLLSTWCRRIPTRLPSSTPFFYLSSPFKLWFSLQSHNWLFLMTRITELQLQKLKQQHLAPVLSTALLCPTGCSGQAQPQSTTDVLHSLRQMPSLCTSFLFLYPFIFCVKTANCSQSSWSQL